MSTVPPTRAGRSHLTAQIFAALNAMLDEYNVGQVGVANQVPLWLFVRDAAGEVQGGLRGETYWSWCTIDVLAIANPIVVKGSVHACWRRRKRLRKRVVVSEFGSTPQAFKHLVSITEMDIPNLAASRLSARPSPTMVHEAALIARSSRAGVLAARLIIR